MNTRTKWSDLKASLMKILKYLKRYIMCPITIVAYSEEIPSKQIIVTHNIFLQVNVWQSWWDRKKALQDRAKDPNRLFARRGNTLLKEQQEEKEVKRNLPKVERELRGMVQEYDNRHGKILKIKQKYGVSIYITTRIITIG